MDAEGPKMMHLPDLDTSEAGLAMEVHDFVRRRMAAMNPEHAEKPVCANCVASVMFNALMVGFVPGQRQEHTGWNARDGAVAFRQLAEDAADAHQGAAISAVKDRLMAAAQDGDREAAQAAAAEIEEMFPGMRIEVMSAEDILADPSAPEAVKEAVRNGGKPRYDD